MPAPATVRCHREFAVKAEADAYKQGLLNGACELSQPGSEPWCVRMEQDLCSPHHYHVYLQYGRYDAKGCEVFE